MIFRSNAFNDSIDHVQKKKGNDPLFVSSLYKCQNVTCDRIKHINER